MNFKSLFIAIGFFVMFWMAGLTLDNGCNGCNVELNSNLKFLSYVILTCILICSCCIVLVVCAGPEFKPNSISTKNRWLEKAILSALMLVYSVVQFAVILFFWNEFQLISKYIYFFILYVLSTFYVFWATLSDFKIRFREYKIKVYEENLLFGIG